VLSGKMAAREMVVVLDFLMGYESFVTFVSSLSRSRRFQFSFIDYSLV
jgi:hypothetical protein